MAIGKQQYGITMDSPETAQQIERYIRQWNETILITLGIANMNTLTLRIDITHLQAQSLTKSQAKAVDSEIKDPVTERAGGHK